MGEFDNVCMSCMKKLNDGETVCPSCGFNNESAQKPPYLPHRTILNGRYLVGEMIEHSSDGITYMGYDLSQQSQITIREFMPRNLCNRAAGNNKIVVLPGMDKTYYQCLQSFLELWRGLAKMRELSAIIPVYDIFEEHNTAFSISEYVEYITLRDYLLRVHEGHLTWDKARPMFMPVLSTLIALHNNGIIHRGISPNSMIVCRDGKVRLSGFSIWQSNTQGSGIPFHEQSGYNALEQYNNDQQSGPWTDIYSYCATLYRALVGNIPIDALTREINDKLMIPANLAEQIPAYVINAMGNGLQIYPANRTRTVEQLRDQLSASPSEAMANGPIYEKKEVEQEPIEMPENSGTEIVGAFHDEEYFREKKEKQKIILFGIIAGILIVALAFGGIYFIVQKQKENEKNNTEISTTQPEMIAVPNFRNYTETETKNNSNWNKMFDIQYEYDFSEEIEPGSVISQSVPSGSEYEKGGTITITISKGFETVTLSNFAGVALADAKKQLEDAGFKVQIVYKANDGSKTADTVYSQSLEAGKSYPKGETIYLQVWKEPSTSSLSDILGGLGTTSNNGTTKTAQ